MKNKLILAVAALALALTVSTPAKAQAAPVPVTSGQFAAMVTASGVTLAPGQSTATILGFTLSTASMAPMGTPVSMSITYTMTGGSLRQQVNISAAAAAAILAAGPTPSVANPSQVMVGLRKGVYVEAAR